jgi:hypothetical protein
MNSDRCKDTELFTLFSKYVLPLTSVWRFSVRVHLRIYIWIRELVHNIQRIACVTCLVMPYSFRRHCGHKSQSADIIQCWIMFGNDVNVDSMISICMPLTWLSVCADFISWCQIYELVADRHRVCEWKNVCRTFRFEIPTRIRTVWTCN